MTAVMRRAEARRSASIMMRSSIRWSLAGNEVDCRTNTSSPRTFSWISTKISMSAKRRTEARARGTFRYSEMASARGRLEFPATSFMKTFAARPRSPTGIPGASDGARLLAALGKRHNTTLWASLRGRHTDHDEEGSRPLPHEWLPPQGPPSYMSPMKRLPNNDVPPDLLDDLGEADEAPAAEVGRDVELDL